MFEHNYNFKAALIHGVGDIVQKIIYDIISLFLLI